MHPQDLYTALFNINPADNNSRDLLAGITKKYPYFSAAHFFLLKNTEKTEAGYDNIAAKAALHFENPFLLNYRLRKVDEVSVVEKVARVEKVEKIDIVNKVSKVEEAEEMIFEPLFASDYFASQGIKLSEEVQTGDKLGKQLKSFTEWLKTMKKVHDNKLPVGNEQMDLAVQKLAEKSNEEDDILTESMAEAYLQQGKAKKAKEVFEKLSLFNPSKSAYFAAKIERLTADQ